MNFIDKALEEITNGEEFVQAISNNFTEFLGMIVKR